jgi:hypothetical protein
MNRGAAVEFPNVARMAPLRRSGRRADPDRSGTVAVPPAFVDHSSIGDIPMKTIALSAAALLVGTAAFAQDTTTTIKKEEGVLGSRTTIEKKTEPSVSSSTSVTTTGSVGCTSETKQKTDAFGDTTTTKKTEC